jgi:peptide/nickel transport system ATP-binding protein
MFEMVIVDEKFIRYYPHELSGGMKQRIDLALAYRPKFVLLDEPTTGLDVIMQRSILDNVRRLQKEQVTTLLEADVWGSGESGNRNVSHVLVL